MLLLLMVMVMIMNVLQAGEAVRADEGEPLRPIRRATETAAEPFALRNPGLGEQPSLCQ